MLLISKRIIHNNIKEGLVLYKSLKVAHTKLRRKYQRFCVNLKSDDLKYKEEAQQIKLKDISFKLACPICNTTVFTFEKAPKTKGKCKCRRCQRSFTYDDKYIDLTLTSGISNIEYLNNHPPITLLYKNPLVAQMYENGWRQNFKNFGYPGPDKEFEMILDILKPKYGNIVMDLSCGTGIFTRKFVTCNNFSGVIAVDFSDSMLRQSNKYLDKINLKNHEKCDVIQVKADVARMPFETSSIDAILAGSALHCWPEALRALAEISRILKPDGIFVGTTVGKLDVNERLSYKSGIALSRVFLGNRNGLKYKSIKEIKDLFKMSGLEVIDISKNRQFILFSAKKPSLES